MELERGEDVDIVRAEFEDGIINADRVLEQTKRRTSGGLTLNSPEALEAITNFAEHRKLNPNLRLLFRYITTAPVKAERDWPDDKGGIATWETVRRGELIGDERRAALVKIRNFLRNSKCPQKCEAAWTYLQELLARDDTDALANLIESFEWSAVADDYLQIEGRIKSELIQAGYRDSIVGSQQLFERLFLYVFRRLAQPGLKQLTREELTREVSQSTISDGDHAFFQLITSQMEMLSARLSKVEEELRELAAMKESIAGLVQSAGVAISLSTPDAGVVFDLPELVSPVLPRDEAVKSIVNTLTAISLVLIVGEPGSGKTQLCLLTAQAIDKSVVWISVPRGSTEVEATVTLDRAVELLANTKRNNLPVKEWYSKAAAAVKGKLVVIDDLPRMMPGGTLSRRVEALSTCLQNQNKNLLANSFYKSPALAPSFAEVDAPRLTEQEIKKLLELHGGPSGLTEGLARMFAASTRGLVILVVAAARFCVAQGWKVNSEQLEALLRGDFSKAIKHDSKQLIELTVPDTEARELLYRLSLTVGGFSRIAVERVAAVPPRIAIPGEKLDRLIGLWIQPFVANKFLQSPLVSSELGLLLSSRTKAGVHAVLAFEILRGGVLDPIQVITCFYHFNSAGLFDRAALVLIQALLELTEKSDVLAESWGLAAIWATTPIPADVEINLRLYARALQAVALDMMGRDPHPVLDDIERLLAEAGSITWGVVIASGFLAIRLYKTFPQIANKYALLALRGYGSAKLPTGDPIPRGRGPALEGLLWTTANSATSDADVRSWIETVKQLSKEEVRRLAESEIAADNAVILTDGIWLREYRKGTKDWAGVEALVLELLQVSEAIDLPILHAAAIRTLIMLRAEFQNDIDGAVKYAEQELIRTSDDESLFLIVEVTGRQLAYAKRPGEAIEWLKRAHSINVKGHALWKRNVLITLAELVRDKEPKSAVEYLKEAVGLSRAELPEVNRLIEALAEYALGLWELGDPETAFDACEEAVRLLYQSDEADPYWNKLFLAILELVWYLSSIAFFKKPPDVPNYQPPRQGAFLGLDQIDVRKFLPAQKGFLKMKMAMFAEGIGRTPNAGKWALEALSIADETPGARTIYSLAWLAIVPEILQNDFKKAAQLALLMADSRSPSAAELEQGGYKEPGAKQQMQEFLNSPQKSMTATIFLGLAAACRLATLKLTGATDADISGAIEDIVKSKPEDLRIQNIATALKASFLEEHDWRELRARGRAVINTEAAIGFVYYVGSALKRPLAQALNMQVWLADKGTKLSGGFPSLQSRFLWPFFGAFWSHVVATEAEQFRTAEKYTRSRVDDFAMDVSLHGVKRLLESMAFCLGVDLSDEAKEWLATR